MPCDFGDNPPLAGQPHVRFGTRFLTAVEVIAAMALLMLHNLKWWAFLPALDRYSEQMTYVLPTILVVVVIFSFARMREDLAFMGLHPRAWKQGWLSIAAFTVLSLTLLALAGIFWGKFYFSAAWLGRYIPLMIAQQLALQCFFSNRLYYVAEGTGESPRNWLAIIGSTAAFAALHTPNYALTLGVIWAGGFWAWHFRRYHNLLALCLSHLIMGLTAMVLLGDGPLLRLRVGLSVLEKM